MISAESRYYQSYGLYAKSRKYPTALFLSYFLHLIFVETNR
jgi:hypothetical protein